jgi:hypothetical protein
MTTNNSSPQKKIYLKPDRKPCPFCGGIPYYERYPTLTIIGCKNCDYRLCGGGPFSDPPIPHENTYDRWDKRIPLRKKGAEKNGH